jgi:GntR family transcriptional regulator
MYFDTGLNAEYIAWKKSMYKFNINVGADAPFYKQLIDQVKQMVATYQLKPGERMPTVRALAEYLNINKNTVYRAYQELERENILGTRSRRGTTVTGESGAIPSRMLRENHLNTIVISFLIETLNQGYTTEELEITFAVQLGRWRVERENTQAITANVLNVK